MDAQTLVLASASPRRRRLVGWLGVPVRVTAAETAEDLTPAMPPGELAVSLALEKARAIAPPRPDEIVLAFDTIVVHDGRIMGKPRDREDARRMLEDLRGGTHTVVTGVVIATASGAAPSEFAVSTPVVMRDVPAADFEAWVSGDEVLGCAGAYNIERHLASVADDECFNNVAGMPLCHVYRELASGRAGASPEGLTAPVAACDAALGRRCLLGPLLCGGEA